MKHLIKSPKEAFYYDKEELASKNLVFLIRYYLRNMGYKALVNIRLSQYYYHKQKKRHYTRKKLFACLVNSKINKKITIKELHVFSRDLLNFIRNFVNVKAYRYFINYNLKKFGVAISPFADIDRNFWGVFRNVAITAHTKIGKNVYIEANVTVAPHKGKSILLGDNVHIHTGAVLVGGFSVGEYEIIGANSVVTKNVPPYTTVFGIPAKAIFKLKTNDKS